MHEAPTFVADLAMVAGVAAVTGMLAHALKQPRILGYLLAGLIVGPGIPVPLFADPERVLALAEFGVVLVMFAVGLEFRVSRLVQVLPVSGFTGLVQVGFLLWAGFTVGRMLGWDSVGSAFLGASLAISSTMVVTSIFGQQQVEGDVREHVLGVLVFQDVVAIALIAAMTALAAGKALAAGELALVIARLAGVLVAMLGVGMLLIPRLVQRVVQHGGSEGIAVLAVGLAFGFALSAEQFGYSVALGAFVAGILVAESGKGAAVEHVIEPLRAVFAAIFFVSVGMAVDPLIAWQSLPIAALVAAVVIVAQLGSVAVASLLSGTSLRRAVLSGLALGQIGEFSFIIATIGANADVVPPVLLPTLVTVATITSFTTALLLRSGDRIVRTVDRALPMRVQHLVQLHQTWMERLRSGDSTAGNLRPALISLALDWVGVVILAAVSFALHDLAVSWIRAWLVSSAGVASALVNGVTVVLALPLLVGLFRNARALAHNFARRVVPEKEAASAPGRIAIELLEAIARLVVVVGVGIPALALLRPLVDGPWGEPLLLIGTVAALVMVWRNLGAVEGEYRSGAEQVAQLISQQAGPTSIHEPVQAVLPGLDQVTRLRLAQDAHAVGQTLAQLNVRARTGATVLAIHKPDAEVVLPTGLELLRAGDVLALAGDSDAVARARDLLTGCASLGGCA
jgi:monovalent cation:H+ antiporter-2, CPA2 family